MLSKVISSALCTSSLLLSSLSGAPRAEAEPRPEAKGGVALEALARRATSADRSEALPALAALRVSGPKALDLMFQMYGESIAHYLSKSAAERAADPGWRRLTEALDAVSMQRDSYASRLYWYTDIEAAKAAAQAAGKPILSLRLLGNLNEEFSCANSRFFRTVLYANGEVSAALREHFILHWKSVRPAPRITIDFGDGRKLERTVTGNSIHYVLDSQGRPIDAIPGLYGPKAFLRELAAAQAIFPMTSQESAPRTAALIRYHQARAQASLREWQLDTARTGVNVNIETALADSDGGAKPALQAAPRAMAKSTVEFKTLRTIGDGGAGPVKGAIDADLSAWEKIAMLHLEDVKLDAASVALIRSQYPGTSVDGAALSRIVKNFERNLALDTVRNHYVLHSRLHQWLANKWASRDVDSLNEQIYARLFLTPGSDPWLGLISPDTYTGLVDDGVVKDR